ncbi:MAG: hypothetical protein DRR19_13870 [Candidatus Parabeggiatoa sp. nov. 1]|nr:MAG: hypothetical protein DRR19_13870 [Gammaproteobacteria bacterium]
MLTHLTIKNFKGFQTQDIPLEQIIVLVGRNNSGKTTALQALTLWNFALRRWLAERETSKSQAKQRIGVPVTREQLVPVPTRILKHLWYNTKVYAAPNKPALIEILVKGRSTASRTWQFGMELQFNTSEQCFVRPMRLSPKSDERMPIPEEVRHLRVTHLSAIAGIQRTEEYMDTGSQNTRIAEGRAGDVLRNLLWSVYKQDETAWHSIRDEILRMFQLALCPPRYIELNSVIVAEYYNGVPSGKKNPHPKLDISHGGSGFLQTLLLLTFLHAREGTIILLDEPDAHLEIVRQRDIFAHVRKVALEKYSQLIVATHSQAILEQAEFEEILSFPKARPLASMRDKAQIKKYLTEISSADFMQAEQHGRILYLEGNSDLAILREWARVANHQSALSALQAPFVKYVGNIDVQINNFMDSIPKKGYYPLWIRNHFYGLRQFYPALTGIRVLDKTEMALQQTLHLQEFMWTRQEIENYLLVPALILRLCKKLGLPQLYQAQLEQGDLFIKHQEREITEMATQLLENYLVKPVWENPLAAHPQVDGTNASTAILTPFFASFFQKINHYNEMPKKHFHRLASLMKPEELHPEIIQLLDLIGKQ